MSTTTPLDAQALARYADATSALLGLPIAPEYREGVLRYLSLASGFYALVEAVDLPDTTEPSLAFIPVPPGEPSA